MAHDSRAVANFFLGEAEIIRNRYPNSSYYLASLQLQKLVVITHGYHYLFEDKKKLVSEPLRIGDYEPYFKNLSDALALYGDDPVMHLIPEGSAIDVFFHTQKQPIIVDFCDEELSTLTYVWEEFYDNKLSCSQLSFLTRGLFKNWENERDRLLGRGAIEYPVEALAEHLRKIGLTSEKSVA